MELQIEFKSDRFELSGPLPPDINAGNQMYGEDLAKWLCETLKQWHLDYMDEDWGWLVFNKRDSLPDDERHTICVYAFPGAEESDDGDWMLTLLTEHRTKWLGIFNRWKAGPYRSELARDLLAALASIGVRDVKQSEE